jgi:hyperosmotically inducible protein
MRMTLTVLALAGALSIQSAQLFAQDTSKPAPDNTKVNQRDRSKAERTADQAKNNTTDREMMQKIRRAVVDDKSLSTYAHNVKIIARDGKVTLKGPVRSEDEKQAIEQKAKDVAGAENVVNEITISPGKTAKSKTGSQ